MASPEHLNTDQSGEHITKLYHGTGHAWDVTKLQASYDRPFHVATSPRFAGEYAFDYNMPGDPAGDWEAMTGAKLREFSLHPDAKVHHTETQHNSAWLPEHEEEHVRKGGYDATMFPGGLGIVYNPKALQHRRDIGFEEHTHIDPHEEMEYRHGEDWRDWV